MLHCRILLLLQLLHVTRLLIRHLQRVTELVPALSGRRGDGLSLCAWSCFLQAEATWAPGLSVGHLSFLCSKGPSSMEVKTIRARPRRQEEA